MLVSESVDERCGEVDKISVLEVPLELAVCVNFESLSLSRLSKEADILEILLDMLILSSTLL